LLDVANGAIANPAASGLLVCSPIVAWLDDGGQAIVSATSSPQSATQRRVKRHASAASR
jgi:hypothetical protein